MIKETGRIIAIEERGDKRIARVECISKSACASCHNKSDCGVGVVAKAFSDKSHQFEIPYQKGMEEDKFVELEINNSDLIKSSSLAYLVPLLFFIGGALLTKQFDFLSEGILILIAVSCAAVGFVLTSLISNKLFPKEQLNSIIGNKLKK